MTLAVALDKDRVVEKKKFFFVNQHQHNSGDKLTKSPKKKLQKNLRLIDHIIKKTSLKFD
ncbi:MAG TPA: hypothetical protein DIW44_03080 [Anaerolineaceae bacterium]|nr:hypothetical protein [Anaerolineaceae bacterium]